MESSNQLFLQLAAVLGLSAVLGFAVRSLRLPLLVAYLIAGVLLSTLSIFDLGHSEVLTAFPEIGIAFVLFFIGMELDLKEIKNLGKPIIVGSLAQIIVSAFVGYGVASMLNFPRTEALFLGLGLAFSSTIVVVKFLLDRKDTSSLYGKLSIGILLLEDLVAIIMLMMMTVGSSVFSLGWQNSLPMVMLLVKGIGLLILALVLSRYVLERLFQAVAESSELLFLAALAWCFVFVAVSILIGFSVVIGAFLAGVALANSPFHYEIQGKVKPLRDFFVTLFFVYLGSQVVFMDLMTVLPLIIIFTLYALFVKPLIFLAVLGPFGFSKHTLFQTSIVLSHISEFSLIVMVIGLKTGMVSQAALTAMALTGVLSIIAASVMISNSRAIYKRVNRFVGFFERRKYVHEPERRDPNSLDMQDHAVLIGAHRMGGEIIKFFQRSEIPFMVVDFNPKIVKKLAEEKINVLYGDIGDPDIVDFLNLEHAKLIISTAQDVEDNLMLLAELKRFKTGAIVICRASSIPDAQKLYARGANFVILPEMVSGDYISDLLKNHWPGLGYFKDRPQIELNKLARKELAFG